MADISEMPYAAWLEQTVQELFDICPVSIALQMRDANGQTYTCYWNCSRDDMACMMDALHDDALLEFLRANKDMVKEILDGEEDDEDGLQDADTETDSEG